MMTSRVIRAALTQTVNAFPDMPAKLEDLPALAGRLEEIRAANVAHHVELLGTAKAQGARVSCFGELFTAPYFALRDDPMWLGLAEDALTGPTVTTLRQVARQHSIIIIAPLYELASSGRRFNTAVVTTKRGAEHVSQDSHSARENEQGSFWKGTITSAPMERTSWAHAVEVSYFPVWETSAEDCVASATTDTSRDVVAGPGR